MFSHRIFLQYYWGVIGFCLPFVELRVYYYYFNSGQLEQTRFPSSLERFLTSSYKKTVETVGIEGAYGKPTVETMG